MKLNSNLEKLEDYLNQNPKLTSDTKDCYHNYQRLFILRRVAEFLLCSVFIYVGINFLILSHFQLPLWPATGVALTMVFLRGNYPYAGILVGAIGAFYINCHYFWFSLFQGIGFTLYIYLTRLTLLKIVGPIQPLNNLDVLTSFLSIITLYTIFHVFLVWELICLAGLPWPFSLEYFYVHLLAQLNGILCLTPFTLMFNPFTMKKYFSWKKQNVIWIGYMLAILSSHLLFFWIASPIWIILLLAAIFIGILLFSYRFSQIPTSCLLLGMGLIYLAGITDYTAHIFNSFLTQTYLTAVCVFGLYMATYSVKVNLRES